MDGNGGRRGIDGFDYQAGRSRDRPVCLFRRHLRVLPQRTLHQLAARRLGAERIILLGHQESRLSLGRRFGATDLITSRGEQAEREVVELTGGGAESVMECVGTKESMETAIAIARPGGSIGYVGVPHGEQLNLERLFFGHIALRGGGAPVRAYLPELLADVLAGRLDPSPVLDLTVDLDGVPSGYAAMDQRTALKVMVRP